MVAYAAFESMNLLNYFDFPAVLALSRSVVLEMATCSFVGRNKNWLILGLVGVGVVHLTMVIVYEAMKGPIGKFAPDAKASW
jgi:DNA replication protein DnaC